jgi:hypothetical protein
MGMTDKFQGTGVYSGIKMDRAPKQGEEEDASIVKGKVAAEDKKTSADSRGVKK